MILVSMPYAQLTRPPMAMGLLPAILLQHKIEVKAVYANLLFAEQIGGYLEILLKTHKNLYIPEFLFSEAAFPGTTDVDHFLADLVEQHWHGKLFVERGHGQHLARYCKAAEAFTDELAHTLLKESPGIIGCSSTFLQHVPSLALLRKIKALSPETITLLGGANCEGVMGQATHRLCPWVDYVVSGDADAIITPLVKAIRKQGRELPIQDTPVGVYTPLLREKRYQAPQLSNGITRAVFRDLESLPTPDFTDYFTTLNQCPDLNERIQPGLSAESSRGCWWGQTKGCRFCALNGKAAEYSVKPAHKTMAELTELSRTYGINQFSMVDNIIESEYFSSFLPMLEKAGKPFKLFYETRSNLGRPEFEAMHRAGINWIQPGVESLSSKLLQHMNKGVKAWHHIRLLKLAIEYGIRFQWFLMHSFPGEKSDWYQEMTDLIPYLHHLQPPHSSIPMQYCRFSDYFENADAYGVKVVSPPMAGHVFPFKGQDLFDLMSSFEPKQGRGEVDHQVLSFLLEDTSVRRLRAVMVEWMLAFWDKKKKSRPVLEYTDDGKTLTVCDTREVATNGTHTFTGKDRSLYLLFCETYPLIYKPLEDHGDNWRHKADPFIQKNLAVELDSRVVGLAHPKAKSDFPLFNDFPGGGMKNKDKKWAILV